MLLEPSLTHIYDPLMFPLNQSNISEKFESSARQKQEILINSEASMSATSLICFPLLCKVHPDAL